jgi:carbon storage regulator
MLVLARKAGESVVIGDGVVVTVLQTNRKTIRLGIQAPAQVRISRREAPARVDRVALHSPEVAAKK